MLLLAEEAGLHPPSGAPIASAAGVQGADEGVEGADPVLEHLPEQGVVLLGHQCVDNVTLLALGSEMAERGQPGVVLEGTVADVSEEPIGGALGVGRAGSELDVLGVEDEETVCDESIDDLDCQSGMVPDDDGGELVLELGEWFNR